MPDTASQTRDLADGFDVGGRAIPPPPVPISDEVRERLSLCLMAVTAGYTPEDIAAFLADGFPQQIRRDLTRVGEQAEMSDHVDLLLNVLHDSERA